MTSASAPVPADGPPRDLPPGEPDLQARQAPTRRPAGVPIAVQHWRQLLFVHWEVPVSTLRGLVPSALDLDTFDGRAYVGAIPFLVRGTRASFLPPLPGVSDFYEVNLRTYVHHAGGDPGVWFFSLDASNTAAVLAARAGWRLPYYRARASLRREPDGTVHYRSERLPPGPTPARLEARYRVGEVAGVAQPGTLDHFLIERYLLYTDWTLAGMMVGQVHHQPYPLQRAMLEHLDCDTLARAHGLPGPSGEVHVRFSPGVDAEIFGLRRPRPK